jgi:hypothetical protein
LHIEQENSQQLSLHHNRKHGHATEEI